MKITPITDYKEFYRTKDLPGCDLDLLLAEVADKGGPEILSFLSDVDIEQMAVQSSELCNHIIYYNMRQLLKLPTLGVIDQKQKYCSIYNSNNAMRNFFKGQTVKMVTYRTVAEAVILYGLTAEELRTISRWCCTFTMEEKNSRHLDFSDLTGFYNKKALSKLINEHIDPATSSTFPSRIMKGMEYPSYADFLHAFRAAGQDPYEALVIFAHRKVNSLGKLGADGPMLNAFELEYLDDSGPKLALKDLAASVENKKSTVIVEEKETMTNSVEDAFAATLNRAIAPMTRQKKSYLVENIRTLRKGTPGGENAEAFDALFLSSGCSNLDVFNYLARISASYKIPLYALFYHKVVPGQYPPQNKFTTVEYKLREIDKVVNCNIDFHANVTDFNLFEKLSIRPAVFLNYFGEPWNKNAQTLTELMGCMPHQSSQPLLKPDAKSENATVEKPPARVASAALADNPTPIDNPGATEQNTRVVEDSELSTKPAEKEIAMTVNTIVRICRPCAADAWENDNPDKTKPGFFWDNATPDEQSSVQRCVNDILSNNSFDLLHLKDQISETLKLPFKAKTTIIGNGIKASIEIS